MKVLGIETSCDETAVCLIEASGTFGASFTYTVLGNALHSQVAVHAKYGGVFPSLAKREHAKNLVPVLTDALKEAGELHDHQGDTSMVVKEDELRRILAREPELADALLPFVRSYGKPGIDAIAVTVGPGLEPALWVGVNFAKALSYIWNVPLVTVNHMEGHIILSLMEHSHVLKNVRMSGRMAEFEFPMLALLISGGHTELVLSRESMKYERIGETRDDAAGEAFDKVARLLGLPYPGGPEISRLAAEARNKNIVSTVKFTRPMLNDGTYDFSFSGLKTAVRKVVEAHAPLSDEMKLGIAREFEDTVADVLVTKTLRAVEEFGANTVVVGGGVSANTFIRERLSAAYQLQATSYKLLLPPSELSTDNALMIALVGYFHAQNRDFVNPDMLQADGNLRL